MDNAEDQPGDDWGRLMRAALGGDDSAYRQLLGELAAAFRKDTRARLMRYGLGNADVEDIVQETLLAVHLKRDTWDRDRPLGPWAYAVLRYKITDRLRRDRSRLCDPVEDHAELAAPAMSDPTVANDVTRMLSHLAVTQRRIVTAMTIEGRSAAEVASETGSSEGAVRVALHRALKRLAAVYREAQT